MRIATFNVNSLKVRLERVVAWLESARPDVLCLQETKMADSAFPAQRFAELGYEAVHHGDGRWNGVAVLSRVGLADVRAGMDGPADEAGCRLLAATCGGVRVHCAYVPNGREVGSAHFEEKLRWLASLRDLLDRSCAPGDDVVVCGDMNVAPEDRDVWDPAALVGATHVTLEERRALGHVQAWGLSDALRLHFPQSGLYSWWDYRGGAFHRRQGMRIDLVLLSGGLAERCSWAVVDRNERRGAQPSDHAPVLADVAEVDDGTVRRGATQEGQRVAVPETTEGTQAREGAGGSSGGAPQSASSGEPVARAGDR